MVLLLWTLALAEPSESTRVQQLIDDLRLQPLLDRIMHTPSPPTPEAAVARVNAIQEVMIELSRAALTLNATLARLEREESEVRSARNDVRTRHDQGVTRWNIAAVLVGNGFAIAGSAMQLGNDRVAKAGDIVTMGGASLAAAFSIVALLESAAERMPHPVKTNLLAPFFDRVATPTSTYPDWIWRYLDTPIGAKSIRRELVDNWKREGQSSSDWMTQPLVRGEPVDAKLLSDRADMLADVSARLASVNVDLELIWREVEAQHGSGAERDR